MPMISLVLVLVLNLLAFPATAAPETWSPRFVLHPSKKPTATWTGVCDHRHATVCGIQNAIRIVDDAIVNACPTIVGPTATETSRNATIKGIHEGNYNLQSLQKPELFGLFAIRGDGVVVGDSLMPETVGTNLEMELGRKSGLTHGLGSYIGNRNLTTEIRRGERRYTGFGFTESLFVSFELVSCGEMV